MIYSYKVKPSTSNTVEFEFVDGTKDIFGNFHRMTFDSFFEWLEFNTRGDNVFVSRTLLSDTTIISKLAIINSFQYDYFKFYIDRELFNSPLFKVKYNDFFYYHNKCSGEEMEKISLNMQGKLDYTLDYFLTLYSTFDEKYDVSLSDDFKLQPYEILEFCDMYREKIIESLSKVEFKRSLYNRIATYVSVSLCLSLGLSLVSEFAGLVPTVVTGAISSAAIYPLIHRSYVKDSKTVVTKKIDSLVALLKRKYFIMSYDENESLLQVDSNPVLKLEHKEKGL